MEVAFYPAPFALFVVSIKTCTVICYQQTARRASSNKNSLPASRNRTDELGVSSEPTSSSPGGIKYYIVDIITLYKGEPDVTYLEQIIFSTAVNEGACGVNPNIGEEYLFGLHRIVDSLDHGELWVTLCGLFLEWSAEDEEGLAMCANDPCDGACDEFEVRQQ